MLHSTLLTQLLDMVFQGDAAPTITGPFVISLHTGAPGTTRANEVSTGIWTNYARQSVARSSGGWDDAESDGASGYESDNAAIIDFGTAAVTGTAPVVSHVEIWDSSGTPRRIGGVALASPQTISDGNPVTFPVASLAFSFGPA